MGKVGFLLAKLWAYGVAYTPFRLLYLRSDFYAFMLYHVVRYRRKVVRENLQQSFPEKSRKELKAIEKRFYRNMCDVALETCKMLHVSLEDLRQRVTFTNPELIEKLYEQRKSVFFASPHSGNWEWVGMLMRTLSDHKSTGIYKRLHDPYLDAFMLKIRQLNRTDKEYMLEADVALRGLAERKGIPTACLIVADQSPRGVESDYWTEFLHRETCWFTGLERMAKLLDYAVVFVEMSRQGRGRYEVTLHPVSINPKETAKNEIVEQYVRHVERLIVEQPDNWLWSHRRWKHVRNTEKA